MPVEAKLLFRPDVLRPHLLAFQWPPQNLPNIKAKWAEMLLVQDESEGNKSKVGQLGYSCFLSLQPAF